MNPMVVSVKNLFEQNAHLELAGPMESYMRNQFKYLGLKNQVHFALMRQYYLENGYPNVEELTPIVIDLWNLTQREFQYVGIGLLGKYDKVIPEDFIQTLEYLLITKSWWDTVDSLAAGAVAKHFQRYPDVKTVVLPRWRKSENIWLRRTTIIFQLMYKKQTDFPLMCEIIRENLGSKEFFINKAIGWALRQYSRVDAQAVRDFVAQTPLQPLSAREALKWLDRKKISL